MLTPKTALIGLLSLLAAFGVGWGSAAWVYFGPRIETLELSVQTAQAGEARQKASAASCAAASLRQNLALDDLRGQLAASQVEAIAARQAAIDARAAYDGKAADIIAEQTPAGANACEAASAAFDAELRRERGIK